MNTTSERRTGVIKAKKSKAPGEKATYGFIRDSTDGTEYFFVPMEVQNKEFAECQEGDPVSFTIEQHAKGLRAVDIEVMEA